MGLLDSIFGGITNYLLQKDQQSFNHSEAQIAYNRALEADSTKYQRQVADMQAAGLNPMLAAGAGAGSVQATPATSSQASVSRPDLLGGILALKQFGLQKQVTDAEVEKTEAETDRIKSQTEGQDLSNEITRLTKDATVEGKQLSNALTRAQVRGIESQCDERAEHMKLLIEQAKTEFDKRALMEAQAMYARANARQIAEMLPYEKAYKEAATEEARQAALLSAAHAAYQNGLLTSGYLDAFVREQKAEADSAEAKATIDRIAEGIRTGDYSKAPALGAPLPILTRFNSAIANFLDNFNPLTKVLK